jgi:ATP-dependent exoDNAse (exonuclease V) beta subunit
MYVDGKRNLCAMRLVGCSPWDLLEHVQEERDRDVAEGVRVAYVAATRARDLLVVPAVGDESIDGWVSPLNKAIYPPMDRRRQSLVAPGCPPFGIDTVLARPIDCDEPPRSSVKPGLHRPEHGTHSVVWWDPATLRLEVRANFGIRQKEILGKDASGKAAREGLRRYEEWKTRRARAIEKGQREQFNVFTVTEATEPPAGFQAATDVELLEKPVGRPQGPRFGTLVHTILRDVDLNPAQLTDGNQENVVSLARIHGRVLGSPPEEIAAAITAVSATLGHPLVKRAAAADQCHRELPIMLKTDDGRLVEGNIDLAFLEDGVWTIVDFKTDADLPSKKPQYQRQLQWYVFALSKITGAHARGWLLGV